jgi:1,5-anhydro-D-fructose reductase (1,5-anhydro-D-mannitol-forming)
MLNKKRLQWGMIGCGNVTERKSAPSFNKIPGSKLVAVGSRTPEKAKDYAERHGVPSWYRDPHEVIADQKVDIVYIATPPGSHMEYALECIRAGKPVYIEKPMARTWEECRVINEAAGQAGVPVFVAYYRRSLEYFNRVKAIVEEGKLGRILQVSMQQYFPARQEDLDPSNPPWRVIPEVSGGGYFHDMGCHALDILFYIFGDPVHITGTSVNLGGLYRADDTVSALLTLPGNVPLTAGWSFVTPVPLSRDQVVVTGKRGSLRFSVFSFDPIRLTLESGEETFHTSRPEHIQMPLIRTIVEEMSGKKGACPSTGLTASVTSRVMDRVTGTIPQAFRGMG